MNGDWVGYSNFAPCPQDVNGTNMEFIRVFCQTGKNEYWNLMRHTSNGIIPHHSGQNPATPVVPEASKGEDSIRKSISVIGACVNEGQDYHTGVETAPRAFREAGLLNVIKSLGYSVTDAGDITVVVPSDGGVAAGASFYKPGTIKNAQLIGDSCGRLHASVLKECRRGPSNFVLTLGGDHSVAIGSISAIKEAKKDIAVVWVDAHADCNTPSTSPSGNFHGMPLGLLLKWFTHDVHPSFGWIREYLEDPLPENRLAYIGLRDVDEGEKQLLRNSNLIVYSMTDVERLGIAEVMERILAKLSPDGCRPIHLSFDIDGIDPQFAPGTGTRAKGGLNLRESRYICTRLAETGVLQSMDLVEVNPRIDVHERDEIDHGDNPNLSGKASMTVKLGIDLIECALGKTLV